MNIYTFEYKDGQTDWVFAPDIKKAKSFYLSFTLCGDLNDCKVTRLPKSKWATTYIIDPDDCDTENEDDDTRNECGYKIVQTFKEYAEQNTQTDIIATTEF